MTERKHSLTPMMSEDMGKCKGAASDGIALWNPKKAALYGFFLLPPIGMGLHALNWRRLYVKRHERANWIWLIGYVIVITGWLLLNYYDGNGYYHPDIPVAMVSMTYSILWESKAAGKQIAYLREMDQEFACNLFWPFFTGYACLFAIGIFIYSLFDVNLLKLF